MDIKAKIDEIISKIKGDKGLLSKFQKEPVKTIEDLIGVDLPDEQVKKIVEGVKAKLNLDKVTDKIEGIFKK